MPVYNEELTSSRFYVDFDSQLVAVFKECSGLSGEIEIETFKEGGVNDHEHKLPGRIKYGNLTLRGGVANAVPLWDWFSEATTGQITRRNFSIIVYEQDCSEAIRWDVKEAYPVRWQGPDFKAEDNSVAVQSLELAHNGIKLNKQNLSPSVRSTSAR